MKPAVLLVCLICCAAAIELTAQPVAARSVIYVDVASKGAFYSVNYDRVLSRGNVFSKSYRLGFSFFKNVLALPMGINFFTGKKEHHAEISLTVVPYIENYRYLFSSGSLSDKKIYVWPGAGYRYQQPGGGLFCKIVLSPVISLDPAADDFWKMDAKLYPGIAAGIGISF